MSGLQGSFDLVKISTVYGSPGSGKTTAVEAAFMRGIASGLSADQVLVLAATRESANTLRDSLALKLQGAVSGSLARTVSSFAFGVMHQAAVAAGHKLPELISGSEQDRLLAEIIESHLLDLQSTSAGNFGDWPKHITPTVLALNGFRAELRDLIIICLEYGVSPDSLAAIGLEQKQPVWPAAANLYREYLAAVSGVGFEHRFDPSQLIRSAADWLQTNPWPKALLDLRLILVDDAQELTPAAAHLIQLLTRSGADLALFGDPDASTLGFRSADARAMSALADAVAAANQTTVDVTFLPPGERAQGIANVLGKVSNQIETARAGRQRKGLLRPEPDASADGVEGQVFLDEQSEISWLARRLRELHLYDKIQWSQMAVVARSQGNLQQLASELSYENIPVRLVSQSPLRDEFGSRALLRFCWVVLTRSPISIELALELFTSPLCGLDSLGLRRLRRALRREELAAEGARNSDELLVALFDAPGALAALKGPEIRRVASFLETFFAAQEITEDQSASIEDLLWLAWSRSGLDKSWRELSRGVGEVSAQANRNLDSVVELFAAANRYVERHPGAKSLVFVEQQLALGLPEDSLALNNEQADRVSLMTPAALIGRTFDVVALPQLIEGVWPNLKPRSSLLGATALSSFLSGKIDSIEQAQRSELPDELRMLYKSVGAAYRRLIISATDSEDRQISQFVSLMLGTIPTPIAHRGHQLSLRGLVGSLRRQLATDRPLADQQSAAVGLARLSQAGIPGANPDSWYGLKPISTTEPLIDLADPEAQVFVRPSQLENYLKCPLHWFINAHGGSDSTFSANLGTLLHEAFELATEVTDEALWKVVESKWHSLKFESDWLEQAGQRRAKAMVANLVQYAQQVRAQGGQVAGAEIDFEFELGRAKIRGQVDRLEVYPDGKVFVVDLKTGAKQFTAAEAQSHPQLGLYQLAYQHGAFAGLTGLAVGSHLAGAKLLLVNGTKPTERVQESLAENQELQSKFESLVAEATEGMAMADKWFVAEVGSHCSNENEFGTCQIHLTKAVSFGG
ncbi:DNA helicase [Rhodoluna sp. KAS3]|nr:DNA helicase [Rhodoluna sp. KAS3]